MAMLDAIGRDVGMATTAKITVKGRFSQLVDKQRYVIGLIEHHPQKRPSLPWGLPVPEEIPTRYVIAIAASQWKSVAETMSDPEDAFIIEGYPEINFKLGAIAIYTESITTKKAQEARRQSQQQD